MSFTFQRIVGSAMHDVMSVAASPPRLSPSPTPSKPFFNRSMSSLTPSQPHFLFPHRLPPLSSLPLPPRINNSLRREAKWPPVS